MTKRRAITLATKVAVLQSQALCGCGCGAPLKDKAIEWDHCLAHALEGSDGPENIRAVLVDCHAIISNGTKATTAGCTKAVVAKVKRLRGETCTGPKAKIPSRPFPKSQRKLASRPLRESRIHP